VHRLQVPRGTPALTASPARPRLVRTLAVSALVVAVDQVTKAWAVHALADRSRRFGFLRLALARNPGGAFSTFTRATPVLAVLAIALTFVLIRMTRRTDDAVAAIALALVLGGAIGNLSDRLFRAPGVLSGHVVDFIVAARWWPTFNVADSAITVGAVLLLVRGWRSS
jgi:signal peptidase II